MIQQQLATLCSVLMVWCLFVPNAAASQSSGASKPTLQEQITRMPIGSAIDVKLKLKKTPPMRGRLGAVSHSAFELQRTVNNQAVTETVAFQDVRSVKPTGKKMSTAGKVGVGIAIGIALFIVVLIVGYGIENKGL
jgi:hypothetical protein